MSVKIMFWVKMLLIPQQQLTHTAGRSKFKVQRYEEMVPVCLVHSTSSFFHSNSIFREIVACNYFELKLSFNAVWMLQYYTISERPLLEY